MPATPHAPARPRPVAMVTHSYYEEDPRVRREAESLVAAGIPVDVFALRRPGDGPHGTLEGVSIRRLNVQRHQGAGIVTYLVEYLDFLLRAAIALVSTHPRRRYRVVHVHTLPDYLVFAALPLKLAGVPVILDLHEAMPEFFRMRFGARLPGTQAPATATLTARIAHALLLAQERASIAVADAVLTVNDALADRLVGLGVPRDKVTVLLNTPSLERFDPARHPVRAFAEDGIVRLVYAGAITPTYELDVALRAVGRLRTEGRPVELDLYGRGDSREPLEALAGELGIEPSVRFHGRVPIESIPAAVAAADIGLAPTRRSEFTDFSLSTKIFEYAAMGKPVVASDLPTVERYFPDGALRTYEPGDDASLAAAIATLIDDPAARASHVERTAMRAAELTWARQFERYLAVLNRLATG
ncbi:MAG TPA: glycosyltransferase family 4 protein [Candidatus Limnocylindrales bacterium]|nr:glycosyltransferase family 4 protein [Candidatus Limnocylindrales bacterium]